MIYKIIVFKQIYLLIICFVKPQDQIKTYITFTNSEVHQIVIDNLNVNRHIKEEVKGPRYCPSLESKSLKYVYLLIL